MERIEKAIKKLENMKTRSAWERGVNMYARELLEELEESIDRGYTDPSTLDSVNLINKKLLNGAPCWEEYSWGGSSLIYDQDIAERLCAPWELKKTDNGRLNPNSREKWLDTQARALYQASRKVIDLLK